MNFYGLWIPRNDSKKLDECLSSGIWKKKSYPNEENKEYERKKIASMQKGDEVFLYYSSEDVTLGDSPFAKYLSEEVYDFGKDIVKVKSVATGKVQSVDTDNVSVIVEWDRPYKTSEWYVYFRQDGVWKFDDTQDQALKNALYKIVFGGEPMDYAWWAEHLDWSYKKMSISKDKKSTKNNEEKFRVWLKNEGYKSSTRSNYTIHIREHIPSYLKSIGINENNLFDKSDIEFMEGILNLFQMNGKLYSKNQEKGGFPSAAIGAYIEYLKKTKRTNKVSKDNSMKLNTILFGPPGTGKTYRIQKEKEKFTYKESAISDEEWLNEIVKDLTWFEVTAMSLLDLGGKSIVPLISKHPFVLAKASLMNKTKGIPQQIWAALQTHTIIESETVNYKTRVEPYVFDKVEKSTWIFTDGYEEIIPEILETYNRYKNDKPQSQELHNYEFVTFHQSYGYEEFVEGIRAIPAGEAGNEDGADMIYKVTDGIFKKMVTRAKNDPEHNDNALKNPNNFLRCFIS